MIPLKTFQGETVAELRRAFLQIWGAGQRRSSLVLKSPTGSGKTIMIANLLKELAGDPQFDVDKAFIWMTFSDDSYKQSRDKLFKYYGGSGEIALLDLDDLSRGKLVKNNVFFINWQKVKTSTKEGRILRKDTERTGSELGVFDEFVVNTQRDGREIVLIVDEAHTQAGTELAQEIIDLIDPKIILKITATPSDEEELLARRSGGWVEVPREKVVKAGLIKEKIVTQTKEDLDRLAEQEIDQDNILLEMAYKKRANLILLYKRLGIDYINPLVLIQLPNDDQAHREIMDKSKLDIVKEFLINKGVEDDQVAIWLSQKKENLDEVERNDSRVSYLIFKQAAATGWDCPRAHILVMFREIKNPTFHTQTVGRILRMPQAEHYEIPDLNNGYLYTNYERNQINLPDKSVNKPFIYSSHRSDWIRPITLHSVYLSRTDFNDLGMRFQFTFERVADEFFGITQNDVPGPQVIEKLDSKGINLREVEISNKLIADAEIEDYDEFIKEIKKKGTDYDTQISKNDLERLYNLLCFNIILKQDDEKRKFAPERSWMTLKRALNVWFQKRVTRQLHEYYQIIVKDLLKEDGALRAVIGLALETHKPIRQMEVKEKEARKEKRIKLEIPREVQYFTDDYEMIEAITDVRLFKNAMYPFYNLKDYIGKANELRFVRYLEYKDLVEWWYKNGNYGSDNFAIKYLNEERDREDLFYPDWIIWLKDSRCLIVDTKSGMTRTSPNTKWKAESLQRWITEQNQNGQVNFVGGIVSDDDGQWKINFDEVYDPDLSCWERLSRIL